MTDGCPDCTRLWSEYAQATTQQFKIENKLQLAGLQHDHEAVTGLIPQVQAAANSRTELRQQIAAHERQVHYKGKEGPA